MPASIDCVCLYITYLSDTLKYTTICNYLSAVWSLHDFMGCCSPAKDSFLVKCTMMGAKRLLGDSVLSADPLLPKDLMLMYSHLDFKSLSDLMFWAAVCLAFRCLLRSCQYTGSIHHIKRNDVKFTRYGLCLTIKSSKTIQFREREVVVPVIASPGSVLCPVRWLKKYLKTSNMTDSAPLFVLPGSKSPMSYKFFSMRLTSLLTAADLKGKFSTHSLRRGSATFLSRIGLPLHDIKTYGDWRSLSVLLYLAGDIETRLLKDHTVARSLREYHV